MKRIDIERLIDDNTLTLNQGQRAFIDKIIIAHDKFQFHGFIMGDGLMEYVWYADGHCILPGFGNYDIVSGHCFVEENEEKQDSESNKADSDVPAGCLPFDVEKAKEGCPVVTRDGRPARIIYWDAKGHYPIIALVDMKDVDVVLRFCLNGNHLIAGESDNDLFMAPVKHEGWVNVYKTDAPCFSATLHSESVYLTKDDAMMAIIDGINYIATVKLEWEE